MAPDSVKTETSCAGGGASAPNANADAEVDATVQLPGGGPLCRRVALRPELNARRISRKPKGYSENPTTLAGHLLKRRKELGLLQREVAERLGISQFTYITWEKVGRTPTICYWPGIINFLGYDPKGEPRIFAERVAAHRRRNGLTQREMAKGVGIDPSTVGSWETGKHPPTRKGKFLRRLHLG